MFSCVAELRRLLLLLLLGSGLLLLVVMVLLVWIGTKQALISIGRHVLGPSGLIRVDGLLTKAKIVVGCRTGRVAVEAAGCVVGKVGRGDVSVLRLMLRLLLMVLLLLVHRVVAEALVHGGRWRHGRVRCICGCARRWSLSRTGCVLARTATTAFSCSELRTRSSIVIATTDASCRSTTGSRCGRAGRLAGRCSARTLSGLRRSLVGAGLRLGRRQAIVWLTAFVTGLVFASTLAAAVGRIGSIETGLDEITSLGLRDERLQLGRCKRVDEACLRDDEQEHLGTCERRKLVRLFHDTGFALAEGDVSTSVVLDKLDLDLSSTRLEVALALCFGTGAFALLSLSLSAIVRVAVVIIAFLVVLLFLVVVVGRGRKARGEIKVAGTILAGGSELDGAKGNIVDWAFAGGARLADANDAGGQGGHGSSYANWLW